MSAECEKCGADLTYPGDSWPVGACEPCDLRAALAVSERVRVRQEQALREADELARVASELFPTEAGMWDSPRMAPLVAALDRWFPARRALTEEDKG